MVNQEIETRTTGTGPPVTVYAHGLGETMSEARVWGGGAPGTRVFLQFRGHGSTPAPPGPWSYDDLAAELRQVADRAGATRAVGVSLGSAVLMRLLATTPDRFEKVVLLLPASFDRPRERAHSGDDPQPEYSELLARPPIPDPGVLRNVGCAVLVIGQEGDEVHEAATAKRVAAAFPQARLEILPPGGILEAHRRWLRKTVSSFLS